MQYGHVHAAGGLGGQRALLMNWFWTPAILGTIAALIVVTARVIRREGLQR